MLITGIHHVALKCEDKKQFEEAVKFYHEILGMPVYRAWEGGIMIDTGSGLIEIFDKGCKSGETGSINHFALATKDVDKCIETVREAGYKVSVEPKDIEIQAQPAKVPARVAFCIGPVGEEIEFFYEK